MKHFKHMQASSASEAANELKRTNAMLIAGGTDLLGTLKDEILPTYPETVIDLKTAKDMDSIDEEPRRIKIGSLVKLSDVAENEAIKTHCAALAQAAGRVASPTIRHMGTLGGNICQMHRCWYFRVPDDRFHCIRKGGNYCPARVGDNRYHSIFGDENGCFASSSHDTAPALMALSASVSTTKREIPADEFFAANGVRSNVLDDDEVVKSVAVPKAKRSAFMKYALRKTIDFPIVNCAVAEHEDGKVSVVLGGVYPAPLHCAESEKILSSGINKSSIEKAADAAVKDCKPLSKNAYKVEIARTLVKRTLSEL